MDLYADWLRAVWGLLLFLFDDRKRGAQRANFQTAYKKDAYKSRELVPDFEKTVPPKIENTGGSWKIICIFRWARLAGKAFWFGQAQQATAKAGNLSWEEKTI